MYEHDGFAHIPSPALKRAVVPDEDARRHTLLDAVTISDTGVAICPSIEANAEMHVAAVQVTADKTGLLLPCEQTRDGLTVRPHARDDVALRIGFFVGHTSDLEINTAVRVGPYPGEPLVTTMAIAQQQEVMIGLHGIKAAEVQEQGWAEDIGLYDRLGFEPTHTRGIFTRARQRQKPNGRWYLAPITLDHPVSTFQILCYETQEIRPTTELTDDANSCRRKLGAITVQSLQGAFEITALVS